MFVTTVWYMVHRVDIACHIALRTFGIPFSLPFGIPFSLPFGPFGIPFSLLKERCDQGHATRGEAKEGEEEGEDEEGPGERTEVR